MIERTQTVFHKRRHASTDLKPCQPVFGGRKSSIELSPQPKPLGLTNKLVPANDRLKEVD